jgi:hypothetical protein
VIPCNVVEIYWHFRGLWCLHNVRTWLPNYTAYLSDDRTLHLWKIFLYEWGCGDLVSCEQLLKAASENCLTVVDFMEAGGHIRNKYDYK